MKNGFLVNYGRAFGVLGSFMEESSPIGPECSPVHGRKKYAHETWLGLDCPPRPCFRSVFPGSVNRKQHGESLAPSGVTEESHHPRGYGPSMATAERTSEFASPGPTMLGLCPLPSVVPLLLCCTEACPCRLFQSLSYSRPHLLSKFSISPCPPPTFFSTPASLGDEHSVLLGPVLFRSRNYEERECPPVTL